jgi:hypothetical protein
MDARSLLAFVVRNLVLFCVYVLAQLPAAWKIRLDPDAFTRAITFEEDGRRVNTGRWDLAPGHRRADTGAWEYESSSGNTVALEPARVDAFAAWDKFQQEVAMHIPSVGRNGGITYHLPNPELKQKKKKEDKAGVFSLTCRANHLCMTIFAASGSESDSNDGAVDDQHTDDGGKKKKKKKRKKKPVVPPREESDPGVPDSANESEDLGCGPPDIGDLGGEQAEVQNEEQPVSQKKKLFWSNKI